MFSYTYETRYGDFKDFESIKVGSILDIVQDVSTKEAAFCGFGIDKMNKLNMAWLMQGINVSFLKPVKTHIPIEAYTAVQRLKGAVSERCCILKQEGETVVKTVANWFLVDTNKLKVCRIPAELHECYKCHDFNDAFFEYIRPEVFEFENYNYMVKVCNKDIDTNKHLNNQKSADILMDALPFDFRFNNMKVLYKKAAYLGDELYVCVKKLDSGYYVHLQNRDKEICVVGTFLNI